MSGSVNIVVRVGKYVNIPEAEYHALIEEAKKEGKDPQEYMEQRYQGQKQAGQK